MLTEELNNTASETSSGATELSIQSSTEPTPLLRRVEAENMVEVINQEHLQLTLDEAFFLHYTLGALKLSNLPTVSSPSLLTLFCQHSYFPPVPLSDLSSDDPFLVQYAVYHHFRSLGWIVRDGVKFSVDYLIYERGPVFTHAAFAVMIMPSYSHPYWKEPGRKPTTMQKRKGSRDWTWFHCINRVQTQVLKTLVLCYVDIPPPDAVKGEDVGEILSRYKIREFCISRWNPNRNRGKMLAKPK
jgi:tRNA-splicing endonuclease subunit Sen2